MATSTWTGDAAESPAPAAPRHAATVRVTHWITTLCFLALLVTGIEILISHPRFYWGETGNVTMKPLFSFPIPSSRSTVPTGYKYVLPDQNGWSRYLHFEAAWIAVLTGLVYAIFGVFTGHWRRNLLPAGAEWTWASLWDRKSTDAYNPLQRVSYVLVIFGLFPLMIWTGLAMSPGFVAAFPIAVTSLGGQQSARTIHFFATVALTAFLLVHVVMVCVTGFKTRMRAMITGGRG